MILIIYPSLSIFTFYILIFPIRYKSNILFYIEPSCGYNDSKTFYVWFDNISVSSYTENNNAVYSVKDESFIYNWSIPSGWIINSSFITVNLFNDSGDGPS